jgi:tetratricopeptide (TPR) repeat protein
MSRGATRETAARALFDFLARHKSNYERSNAVWQYYMNALGVLGTSSEASTFATVAKEALGYAGAEKSDEKSFKMFVQLLQATASTPVARTVLPQAVDAIAKRSQDDLKSVRMYRQLMEAVGDATAARTLIDKSLALLSRMADKDAADREYASIIDWLRNQRQYELAATIARRMNDQVKSSWKMYEIVGHGRGKWPEAVKMLQDIENNGDGENQLKARKARAWVYKERTREYEKAIKLYHNILEPPGTLWDIQYCYHKLGKLEDAIRTLTEIQNSFPDHAPRAAWTKAEYYHKAKDKKKAIACARYIMKAYTKSPEASRAHQMLEKYGIHTGGGVMDSEE